MTEESSSLFSIFWIIEYASPAMEKDGISNAFTNRKAPRAATVSAISAETVSWNFFASQAMNSPLWF